MSWNIAAKEKELIHKNAKEEEEEFIPKNSYLQQKNKQILPAGEESYTERMMISNSKWDKITTEKKSRDINMDGEGEKEGVLEKEEDYLNLDPNWRKELEWRNRFLTDEELDALLPQEGFEILPKPEDYEPIFKSKIVTNEIKEGFFMQPESMQTGIPQELVDTDNLPLFKPEDVQFFGKLLDGKEDLTLDELKERKLLRLLLRVKNSPTLRRQSMRQLIEKAKDFGAALIFDKLLPLLMSNLDMQERHLLVKVVDRVLYKLDEEVRPFVRRILIVFEPMLIDEDYYARIEGREVISNLAKAAGLATMISVMRPDIDNVDEFVRNTTARAFSVVASALGISALLPFIKAVTRSKKSWQARHTGIKIVQQIAILVGNGILPYLTDLVDAVRGGLEDEQHKVRTISALAIGNLAEASYPYGYESFEMVLKPLNEGLNRLRGKGLAAFMKAIGNILPLMESEIAAFYIKNILRIIKREFSSPDDEMKRIVLKVVKQVTLIQIENEVLEDMVSDYFGNFWRSKMALDKKNSKLVIDTTFHLAKRLRMRVVRKLIYYLKDELEAFRKMAIDCLNLCLVEMGVSEIEQREEELLVDGLMYCFEQQDEFSVMNSIGSIFNVLGIRMKPYLQKICSAILWRLNNKSIKVRQNASELIGRIADVLVVCEEEKMLIQFGKILYEYLGEEYPDALASILVGLKGVVNSVGMQKMEPPIQDLLPRLTPILKNRHEKVQEHSIQLVGRIAERGSEFVSAREWMRICFELLEMLKAHKKSVRRSAIVTFGYIARAIGPQDVLVTLLNNLKVQERQLRLCTTIAIAIVAESCEPFTVLPALMNEYRLPELNVQNGVLKALAFMFEYIGDLCKDYVYAVTPLFEDALMDRDLVHRQTSCAAIRHLSVGCFASDREDALHHLLNFVWPNIFETTAHIHLAFNDAIEGLRLSLGGGIVLQYVLQGLFHSARKVRTCYWRLFNSLHYACQDSLVPFYPKVPNDGSNKYEVEEFYYVI